MKTYLTYAPIAILIVFIYLVFRWFKTQKEFQKETGVNTFSPIEAFKFFFRNSKNETELIAYKKLKQEGFKSFKIWGITILVFIIVTFIVGILTAKK
jgi:hypothetical protein